MAHLGVTIIVTLIRFFIFGCALALVCGAIGCASNRSSNSEKGASASAQAPVLARQESPQQVSSKLIAPPKDAQWTIYCVAIPGDNHVAAADQLKNELLKS